MTSVASIALVVLVLVGTACGAGEPATDRPARETAPPSAPVSPLAAYSGFGHDLEADEARQPAAEVAYENAVAACMQRRGFYYAPSPSVDASDMSREEAWSTADPNGDYMDSLTPRRFEAYSFALAGVPDVNHESPPPSTAPGCLDVARRKVPGVYGAFYALEDEYRAMRRAARADPSVVAARRAWAECMRQNGFGFATWNELRKAEPGGTRESAATAAGLACDEETRLNEVATATTLAHETAFVERHRATLDHYQALIPRPGAP